MNGDDLEENESEEEIEGGNQFKKMIKSNYKIIYILEKKSLNYLFFIDRDLLMCEILVYNRFEQKFRMFFIYEKNLC